MSFHLESKAKSYCLNFPKIFSRAKDHLIYDEDGKIYLDFLSGAGSLNYGHNNELIKQSAINYLNDDGVVMGLDLHTTAKKALIEAFQNYILRPRNLDFKLQFTSPTGTSVVESAIKLARKYTHRYNVIAFTNAYHGMTSTSLSLTGSRYHRQWFMPSGVTRIPYENYIDRDFDTIAYLEKLIKDQSSGLDIPAAVILETVQGEGGINVASPEWLHRLWELTQKFGIILIIDDIQAGCGRTGNFFSFERAKINPDMVCLSKSLSGLGLPFSLLLYKPQYDIWEPGEDNGTFRGNNLAFVTAKTVIEEYWASNELEQKITALEEFTKIELEKIKSKFPSIVKEIRGIGLMYGIVFYDPQAAMEVGKTCFGDGLIIERCGPDDEVVKLMPPLTISNEALREGISIIEKSIQKCFQQKESTFSKSKKIDTVVV